MAMKCGPPFLNGFCSLFFQVFLMFGTVYGILVCHETHKDYWGKNEEKE